MRIVNGDSARPTAPPPRPSYFFARQAVNDIVTRFATHTMRQRVDVVVDVPAGLRLLADSELFDFAVDHLVSGAIAAMPYGGELTITGVATPQGVELEVADERPDTAPDVARIINDPRVQRCIGAHGGRVMAQPCPTGGIAITLCLPRVEAVRTAA